MKMIFLVDGDNNIGTGLQGIDLLTAEDTVLVFFGKGQTLANVKKLCAGTKAQVQYLESVKGGKNSLDFQIITELGVLVGRGEADFAYVISQDKGYEAAMSALHARYASTFREVALRPSIQDCLQAAFLLRAGTREELAAALARQNLADNGLAAALRARDANELGELGGLGEPGASNEPGALGASGEPDASGSSHEPFLSLRSSVRQGHLVIEAKNSISEADRLAWEESAKRSRKRQRTWDEAHGWGLSIISGIAQRHGGSLECAIEDDVFRATVIMRLGSASDAATAAEAEHALPDRAACADDLELAGGVL